jgi:hypothetical protein
MSDSIDIKCECNACHGIGVNILSSVAATSETRIVLGHWAWELCPLCGSVGNWVLVIRPAKKKVSIVESPSRLPPVSEAQ